MIAKSKFRNFAVMAVKNFKIRAVTHIKNFKVGTPKTQINKLGIVADISGFDTSSIVAKKFQFPVVRPIAASQIVS